MRKPAPLPPHLAPRPFTLAQARAAGLSRARTRASDLGSPSRDIRVPLGTTADLLDRCRPYTTLSPSSTISHITAARIHGLYLPSWCENEQVLHLARPASMPQPRRKHVCGHQMDLAGSDITDIRGVPVTTPQRTLLDLAQLLRLDYLVVIADQLVCEHLWTNYRPKLAMVPLAVLNAYVVGHSGLRGLTKLRAAMDLVRVGSDSPPETRLRLMIQRSPLPPFIPNMALHDSSGEEKVHPDLGCEQYRTCIEYDGGHHFTPSQQGKDHDRDFITATLGWHQVKINSDDMRRGDAVILTKIARMLVQGGWADPNKLAERSLRGFLGTRKDFN